MILLGKLVVDEKRLGWLRERGEPLADSGEQRLRDNAIVEVEADPERFISEYTKRFGNVLNADNAATLFDEYNRNVKRDATALYSR